MITYISCNKISHKTFGKSRKVTIIHMWQMLYTYSKRKEKE